MIIVLKYLLGSILHNRLQPMQYEQLYSQNNLSRHSLRNLGFEEGPQSQLPVYLYRAQLKKQTASLRDALSLGMLNFQRLQNTLIQAGTTQSWQFCHVIICSSVDRISSTSVQDAIAFIGKAKENWKSKFRCFIIAVDLEEGGKSELEAFCQVGGARWKLLTCDYAGFLQQFKKIATKLGLGGKRSLLGSQESIEVNINESLSSKSLALTISIEGISKFKGERWQSIVNSLSYYLRNLSNKDIISGIIYSSKPYLLAQQKLPAANPQVDPPANQSSANSTQRQYVQEVVVVRPRRTNRVAYCICFALIGVFLRFMIVMIVNSK